MKGLVKRLAKWLGFLALVLAAAWGSVRIHDYFKPEDVLAESGRGMILEDGGVVDLETFVLYLAAAQVPADYGPETLKCQAVIARTFLFRELGDAWEMAAVDLGAEYWDEADMREAWGLAYTENRQAFVEAVQATAGQTLGYEGAYIAPVFHRMSAGSTRDAGENFPYLKARDAAADLLAEDGLQIVEMGLNELTEALAAGTGCELLPGQFWTEVQIVARDAAGYVEAVQVNGILVTGEEAAAMLGLPSPCFQWEAWENGVRIICRGQGHGYGLSQWGARAQEASGSTYKEILQFYYSGAEIQ